MKRETETASSLSHSGKFTCMAHTAVIHSYGISFPDRQGQVTSSGDFLQESRRGKKEEGLCNGWIMSEWMSFLRLHDDGNWGGFPASVATGVFGLCSPAASLRPSVVNHLGGGLLVMFMNLVDGFVDGDHLVDLLGGGNDLGHGFLVLVDDRLMDLHDVEVVLVQVVLVDSVLVEVELMDVVDVQVMLVQVVPEDELLVLVVLKHLVLVMIVVDHFLLVGIVVVDLVDMLVGLGDFGWGPSPSTTVASIFSRATSGMMVNLLVTAAPAGRRGLTPAGLAPSDGEEDGVRLVGQPQHQED
jgi:hypothetical protein